MFKTILAATDGSAASANAVDAAIALAALTQGKIIGLAVVGTYYPYFSFEGVASGEDEMQPISNALQKEAERNVQRIAQQAKDAGIPFDVHVVTGYSPAQEIVRVANENGCDLICMGSHGKKGLDRLLPGSQTQKVLALSRIPVLVFR